MLNKLAVFLIDCHSTVPVLLYSVQVVLPCDFSGWLGILRFSPVALILAPIPTGSTLTIGAGSVNGLLLKSNVFVQLPKLVL